MILSRLSVIMLGRTVHKQNTFRGGSWLVYFRQCHDNMQSLSGNTKAVVMAAVADTGWFISSYINQATSRNHIS